MAVCTVANLHKVEYTNGFQASILTQYFWISWWENAHSTIWLLGAQSSLRTWQYTLPVKQFPAFYEKMFITALTKAHPAPILSQMNAVPTFTSISQPIFILFTYICTITTVIYKYNMFWPTWRAFYRNTALWICFPFFRKLNKRCQAESFLSPKVHIPAWLPWSPLAELIGDGWGVCTCE